MVAATTAPARGSRVPRPSAVPVLDGIQVAALYRSPRLGGDFYEFLPVAHRLLLMFLDIAGERNRALDIAAAVQDCAHEHARGLFGAPDVNESEAVAQLSLLINRTVLAEAEGVCLSPAFVACYNRDIGTLAYVNAGHTPGLLRDSGSITSLAATGLPFGLFSHSPYEAEIRALEPGAALLLVSRGLVEAGSKKRQFGLERVQQTFSEAKAGSAKELCAAILQGVEKYAAGSSDQNDMTTVALVRPA